MRFSDNRQNYVLFFFNPINAVQAAEQQWIRQCPQ